MKVFLSSVISGMEAFRDTADVAIRTLDHDVIRAEDFGASAASPQETCLAGVREADLVVLILGERYGEIQASGLSATHEEFQEAQARCQVLVMVQEDIVRDDHQTEFLAQVRDWSAGQYTASFSDEAGLAAQVLRALHRFELSSATGPVDSGEMIQRALALLSLDDRFHGHRARIALVIAGGPAQSILRPAAIENSEFGQDVLAMALVGKIAILNQAHGTETRTDGDAILFEQEGRSLLVNEQGSIRIEIGLHDGNQSELVIIEEIVRTTIERCLNFGSHLLDHLDPVARLSHCAVAVQITGGTNTGWRTRAEHAASPNSININVFSDDLWAPVHLSPPHRTRAALRLEGNVLAEDLTVLLRRKWKS